MERGWREVEETDVFEFPNMIYDVLRQCLIVGTPGIEPNKDEGFPDGNVLRIQPCRAVDEEQGNTRDCLVFKAGFFHRQR